MLPGLVIREDREGEEMMMMDIRKEEYNERPKGARRPMTKNAVVVHLLGCEAVDNGTGSLFG
jgi:hypothetical protein